MSTTTVETTFTLREVAELLHVTPNTLRSWVRLGKFPKPLGFSSKKMLWPRAVVEKALSGKR